MKNVQLIHVCLHIHQLLNCQMFKTGRSHDEKQYRMKRQGTYFEFPILHGGSYFHLLKFFFRNESHTEMF